MAIYGKSPDELDLERNAQLMDGVKAFANFIQQGQQNKSTASYQQSQISNQNALTQKQNMENAYMLQKLSRMNPQFARQFAGSPPQQQTSYPQGMMPGPNGWMPNPNQSQMAQNAMPQQRSPMAQQSQQQPQQGSSLQDIVEPERDPYTNQLTTLGEQQDAKNKLTMKSLEAQEKLKVPTAKMQEDLNSTLEQINAFKELRKEAEAAPSAWPSVLARAAGFFTRGADASSVVSSMPGLGALGKIEEEKIYSDNRPAMSTSLYKALTGDTRLSDFDSKRALSLTWDTAESKNIRTKKFDKIERMLQARANLIRQGRYTVNKEGEFVTPLNAVEAESEKLEQESTAGAFEDKEKEARYQAWKSKQSGGVQ